jgi:hypothetical protein
MRKRKEQRAADLAGFREKTRSFIRTFDPKSSLSELGTTSAWYHDYHLQLGIKNIGVAFPLALLEDTSQLEQGARGSSSVRAFLFSIKSLAFGTQRGETGRIALKAFAFQFVSR